MNPISYCVFTAWSDGISHSNSRPDAQIYQLVFDCEVKSKLLPQLGKQLASCCYCCSSQYIWVHSILYIQRFFLPYAQNLQAFYFTIHSQLVHWWSRIPAKIYKKSQQKKPADKTNPSKSFSPAGLMVPVGLPGFLTEERQQNLQIISQIITQHFLLTIDEDLQLSPGQTPQNRNSHSQGYSELSGGLGTVNKNPAVFCWKIQGVQLR